MFGFFTTNPFVTLAKIVVTASGEPGAEEPDDGFAIGELGIG
jgi:hypothetical protein